MKFNSNYSLANDHIKYPQPVVIFDIKTLKKVYVT